MLHFLDGPAKPLEDIATTWTESAASAPEDLLDPAAVNAPQALTSAPTRSAVATSATVTQCLVCGGVDACPSDKSEIQATGDSGRLNETALN